MENDSLQTRQFRAALLELIKRQKQGWTYERARKRIIREWGVGGRQLMMFTDMIMLAQEFSKLFVVEYLNL